MNKKKNYLVVVLLFMVCGVRVSLCAQNLGQELSTDMDFGMDIGIGDIQELETISQKAEETQEAVKETAENLTTNYMTVFLDMVSLPDPIKKALQGISITNVSSTQGPEELTQSKTMSGDITFRGIATQATVIEAQEGKSLSIALAKKSTTKIAQGEPGTWKFSEIFPELDSLDFMRFSDGALIISNITYSDKVAGVTIQPGLNIITRVKFSTLKDADDQGNVEQSQAMRELLNTLEQQVPEITLHGVIKKNIEESQFTARLDTNALKNQKFSLSSFFNFTQIQLAPNLEEVFNKLTITSPNISLALQPNFKMFSIKGDVQAYGVDVDAEFIMSKTSRDTTPRMAFRMQLPFEWKLSDHIPTLSEKFKMPFSRAGFILSNYRYNDLELGVFVEPGLNFFADINFEDIEVPKVFERVRYLVSQSIKSVVFQAVLKKKLKDSVFQAYIPQASMTSTTASLADFFNITTLTMPQNIENIFKKVVFEVPHISFRAEKQGQRLFLQSYTTVYGKRLLSKMVVHRDSKGFIGGSLYIGLPPEWSLKKELPGVGRRFVKDPRNPAFIISNIDFEDEELGIFVKKGLNFTGSVSIEDLPDSPVTKKIKRSIGKIIKDIVVHIIIPERVQEATFQFIALNLDDTVIPLQDLVDLKNTTMPEELKNAFMHLGLIAPEISFTLDADIGKFLISEFMIKSGAVFDKTPVGVRFLTRKNNPYDDDQNDNPAIPNVSVEIQLPLDWNFSKTFKGAEHFDFLDVDNASIIFSNFKYDHPEIDVEVFKGINFVSNVVLDGPLKIAQDFIDKVLNKFMAADHTGKFALSGTIGSSLSNSSFSVAIPARIGIDFDKLYNKKIMSFEMPIFKKVMTSGLELQLRSRISDIEGRPPEVGFELTTGFDVELRSQEESISLLTTIAVAPDAAEISGYMKGIVDPAGIKWLALGELGVDLAIDYEIFSAVLASTGLPLPTGFGMRGLMLLGEPGDKRAEIDIAGKISLSSTGDNDFILLGRGENIDLTHIVWLFGRMADKKIVLKNTPPLKFDKLYIKVVPRSAALALKEYSKEFAATAWFNLFGYKGGIDLSVNSFGVTGIGRLSRIEKPWFRLAASDSVLKKLAEEKEKEEEQETLPHAELSLKDFLKDKDHDGPKALLEVNLFKQRIMLMGKVEIPPLKLSKEAEIDVSVDKFKFKIEENWFGLFETEFDISIGDKESESYVKGKMKQSALTKFNEILQKEATQFRAKATANIIKARADLDAAIKKVNQLKKKIRKKKKKCV